MDTNKNRGLIIPKIENKEEGAEYVLGSAKFKGSIINEKADWTFYLPAGELQNKGKFEPSACVSFGTNSAIETLINYLKKEVRNYSDRALAIGSETNPAQGNDPHKVAEYARTKLGFVPEEVLPFDNSIDTLDKFYSPNPLTSEIIKEGNKFFNEYEFSHAWVFTSGSPQDKKLQLQQALQYGPVCVSVQAWNFDTKNNWYFKNGADSHWCQLISYKDNPIIFDSYAESDSTPFIKVLSPLYDFSIAKVYYLTSAEKKLSILQQIINAIAKIINLQSLLVRLQKPAIPLDERISIFQIPNPVNPDKVISPPLIEPSPTIPYKSSIMIFARAMEHEEGYFNGSRSFRNANPGNMKWTEYTASLGATGKDKDNFCIFQNYQQGFNALCQFISDAKANFLKPYHDKTIGQFVQIYANPLSLGYAKACAFAVGLTIDTPMKDL